MKRILLCLFIFSFCISNKEVTAQCTFNNFYYTSLSPPCPGSATAFCCWGSDYISVNVIAGNSYTFSTCGGTWDSEITLYNSAGTVVLGYNDDGCGLQSTITWIATYTGVVQVLIDAWPCSDLFSCINLVVTCAAAGPPPITAGDCSNAVNICTNLSFSIDPSGFGAVNEIPAVGTLGNPNYTFGDAVLSPWGTDNWGCLLGGELNSTWMIINIATSGSLEFTFGAGGSQTGFYDWIMYPYSPTACAQIPFGTYAPVRCNWNSAPSGGTGLVSALPVGGVAGNYEPPLAVLAGQQFIVCFSNWSSNSTSVPLVFGGTSTVSCTPLPIELTLFNGKKQKDGTNLLWWTTASETNNDYFLIMRSIDAVNWETISLISGTVHSSSANNYEARDFDPRNTINYYRLIQVDLNGQEIPFNIISINNSKDVSGILRITNMLGENVSSNFDGLKLIYYSDGTVVKKVGKSNN